MTAVDSFVQIASPSLAHANGHVTPAFELKFLVDPATAASVTQWACSQLRPDPHGLPALGGAYETTSLYSDTAAMDVFQRAPSYRRRKFRIRRYGKEALAYLERKAKSGTKVTKRRTLVELSEISRLSSPTTDSNWDGDWFHRSLLLRRLMPACLVSYQRLAYFSMNGSMPMRLTIDRALRGQLTSDWRLDTDDKAVPLMQDHMILELKFHSSMPALFKGLVEELGLTPQPVSKYRLCRSAWETANA